MEFCKYCGSPIEEKGVCNCPEAIAERKRAGEYQPEPQPQPRTQPRPQQRTAAPAPAENAPFAQKLLAPLKLYFNDPKKAVGERMKYRDFITALIYVGALFVAMLIEKTCVYGIEALKGKPYINFNFGLVFLAALLGTTALCAVYVLARFVILAIAGKKPFNAVDTLIDSLISFGINSIVPVGLILLGGLLYMAASWLGTFMFVIAMAWYVVAGLLEIKDELNPRSNPFFRLAVLAGATGVAVALYLLLYNALFSMNVTFVIG